MTSTSLQPFMYGAQPVRSLIIDGTPWFVAKDVCEVLEINNSRQAVARLDEDGVSTTDVIDSLGRVQTAAIVSEAALYELVFLSRKPEAKNFKRWITHEVLPQIRKTGTYGVAALTGPELMARAMIEAHATIQAANEKVKELTPRAQAWDAFLSTAGDHSMNEAAKILQRDRHIQLGERRLRDKLIEWGWIYRQNGDPRAYQTQIENGRLTERARYYTDTETGERVATTPQVRVTPKGIDAIARRMHEVAA